MDPRFFLQLKISLHKNEYDHVLKKWFPKNSETLVMGIREQCHS